MGLEIILEGIIAIGVITAIYDSLGISFKKKSTFDCESNQRAENSNELIRVLKSERNAVVKAKKSSTDDSEKYNGALHTDSSDEEKRFNEYMDEPWTDSEIFNVVYDYFRDLSYDQQKFELNDGLYYRDLICDDKYETAKRVAHQAVTVGKFIPRRLENQARDRRERNYR